MKYQLIDTSKIDHDVPGDPGQKMFKGLPYSITVEERDGHWYSKWQVVLHCPSPTGDTSDWIQFDVGCLNEQQALIIAKEHAVRNNIPYSRILVQKSDGNYQTLDNSEYNGRIH